MRLWLIRTVNPLQFQILYTNDAAGPFGERLIVLQYVYDRDNRRTQTANAAHETTTAILERAR